MSADDYIWGVHPVCEMLENHPGRVTEVIFLKEPRSGGLLRARKLAARKRIKVSRPARPPEVMRGRTHQGIAARVSAFPILALEELTERLPADRPPLLIALDRIQDPGNLGAVIRSAAAAGADGVVVSRDNSAPPGGAVMKSSAGTAARIPIARVTNMARTLDALKERGLWIYGADSGGEPVWQTDLSGPACLVMGGEHRGLRPIIRERCDFIVSVPMAAGVESLNVSAAAAVLLFEAARQRGLAINPADG